MARPVTNASSESGEIGVQVTGSGPELTVQVTGRVTVDSSPQLRSTLLRLLRQEARGVLTIDVSMVSYLDTSGIATLLEALKSAQQRSIKLRLVGMTGQAKMLADVLELHEIFIASGSEVVFG
jgi:anti-sigma B factor antagonist